MKLPNNKILIHALGATMGGAMRHLTNFLPELGRQDPDRIYTVLVRDSFPSITVSSNVRIERLPHQGFLQRLLFDIFILPNRLKTEKFDAVVSLTNFGPIWSPVPHIFFQRNALYYWPDYLSKITVGKKIETLLRRFLAIESMKRADVIVTPSNAMAEMIKTSCPEVLDRRFTTLYHGFERVAYHEPLDELAKNKLAVSGYKLFYPSHLSPHKGFDILFSALCLLNRDGIDFTLFATVSEEDWPQGFKRYCDMIRELGIEDRVVFLGNVPQLQMGALYEQCDVMVYPSLCESFGFSMIEAMGHGLPIVAADTAVNREICGNASLYYPPTDSAAGAEAIKQALKPETADQLVNEGAKRMQSFDWGWQRYAREFSEMMSTVIH